MKTMIRKLAPGVLASAFALACVGWLSAQSANTGTVPTVQAPAPVYPAAPQYAAPAPQAITLCGSCGSQIQAPQVVMIAAPVAGSVAVRSYAAAPGYHAARYDDQCAPVWIPPQPIFAGYNHGRAYYPRHDSGCGHSHQHGRACR